jgi:hypothetical protein
MASATMLHIGTPQGLYVASKPGTSPQWRITKHTLVGRPVIGLALGTDLPVRVAAVVPQMGVFHSTNGGREWMLTLPLDVTVLLADPNRPDRIFAGLSHPDRVDGDHAAGGAGEPGNVLVSEDGGVSWHALPALPVAVTRVLSLALTGGSWDDPGRRLWAGVESGGVLYSTYSNAHWQGLRLGLGTKVAVYALATTGGEDTDLFAATSVGIYRLQPGQRATDADWKGTSRVWRLPATPTPTAVRQLIALGRVQHPARPAVALLARDATGHLWRGQDGSGGWTGLDLAPAGGGDPDLAATALAAHPDYPDRAYTGTRSGRIFETRNRGTSWEDLGITVEGDVRTMAVLVVK